MPAAIPLLVAVTAGSAIYSGVEANKERQHAKGAAEAQETANNAALADEKKTEQANVTAKGVQANSTHAAALSALKASLSSTGGGNTILTGPQGAAAAPIAQKTLLGL